MFVKSKKKKKEIHGKGKKFVHLRLLDQKFRFIAELNYLFNILL